MSAAHVLWGFRPGNGTAPYPLMDGTAARCRAELNRRVKAGWICEIAPGIPGALAPAAITARYLGLTSRHDDDLGFTVTRYGDLARYAGHRDDGGFAWTCRTPRLKGGDSWDRAQVEEVCEITSGDRDWYEQHQARHERTGPALYDLAAARKPWKRPPAKAYQPGPVDPGQPVTWTVHIDGHHENPGYIAADGTYHGPAGWVEAVSYERTGTIWSAGPASASTSWWAVPDDDPANPVVIRRHGKKFDFERQEGQLYQDKWWGDWRDGIRRAENVRRRGIFPVVREVFKASYRLRPEDEKVIEWHADPECPGAAGKDRDDGTGPAYDRGWDVHGVVDVLTGRRQYSGQPPFCPRCIMLEPQPEETPAEAGMVCAGG